MLFNSVEFIFIFLPMVLVIYYAFISLKHAKLAMSWLVLASLGFYSYWDFRYLPLLLFSMVWNFSLGRLIEKYRERKKLLLLIGVGLNLLLLGYFKYTGFFLTTVNALFDMGLWIPKIILPLGISFFTFTQTAYLVDAYRGETRGYSFLTYSLFVTIFPHLIAGPILYHKDMIGQFEDKNRFRVNYENLSLGLVTFAIGLCKKVLIADVLSPWVAIAFDNAGNLSFIEAWCGALVYTLQLYFDFSGYSEMAIGLGLMLNFNLPINFNSPYKATSVIDFWRRWHITLSAFLRDYLYIPLGGNKMGHVVKLRNLLITMLLGGLWHGAGWTFVIWGGIHGVALVVNHLWRKSAVDLPKVINWCLTFVCVTVAWVFFRADNIASAWSIVCAMFDFSNVVLPESKILLRYFYWLQSIGVSFAPLNAYGGSREVIWIAGCLLTVVIFKNPQQLLQRFNPNFKWLFVASVALLYGILSLGKTSEFLYFQF